MLIMLGPNWNYCIAEQPGRKKVVDKGMVRNEEAALDHPPQHCRPAVSPCEETRCSENDGAEIF